jgi:hypothetical protein
MLSNTKMASKAYVCAAILDLPRLSSPSSGGHPSPTEFANQIVLRGELAGEVRGKRVYWVRHLGCTDEFMAKKLVYRGNCGYMLVI